MDGVEKVHSVLGVETVGVPAVSEVRAGHEGQTAYRFGEVVFMVFGEVEVSLNPSDHHLGVFGDLFVVFALNDGHLEVFDSAFK